MMVVAVDTGLDIPSAFGAFRGMLARDVLVLRKDLVGFAARTLVQPTLFVFVFAYVLPKIASAASPIVGAGSSSFATTLVPGLVASSAVLTGMTSVTMSLMYELSYTREAEDRLLTPAPIWVLGLEKIAWGACNSLVAGAVVFPVTALVHAPGQAPHLQITSPALLLTFVIVIPLMAGSLGLLLGSALNAHQWNQLMTFIMVPAMMLGCVYYPWSALTPIPWLKLAVLLNPIVYASEGLRAAVVPGLPHMPVVAIIGALIAGTTAMALVGLRLFSRRLIT